ncbi:penicillin acylase family protein, partial [Rubrivirga sp.]|uniref:penicillin acylase family protein n=1 Tax=Rubrivirga sp. TaxID=1885344 RepID=UPI003C760BA1
EPGALWAGLLEPSRVPRVVDPEDGLLWSANSRVVSDEKYAVLGTSNYAHGARARQIRDGLRALEVPISERDLLGIQLDDRALFYARWRDLLLSVLEDAEPMRSIVDGWSGRASPDDAGYRLVRDFRSSVVERVLPPLLRPASRTAGRDVDMPARDETPVWAMITERPGHLLPDGYASWDDLLEQAAAEVEADHPVLEDATWGAFNTLRMEHPMASAIPGIGDRLVMPSVAQPGDSRMPRVSGPSFGASQRMVVSPGHEDRGIFHMPGGQAGHFMSPYWGAGHDDWVEGRPSPFLPGETRWTLTLTP